MATLKHGDLSPVLGLLHLRPQAWLWVTSSSPVLIHPSLTPGVPSVPLLPTLQPASHLLASVVIGSVFLPFISSSQYFSLISPPVFHTSVFSSVIFGVRMLCCFVCDFCVAQAVLKLLTTPLPW